MTLLPPPPAGEDKSGGEFLWEEKVHGRVWAGRLVETNDDDSRRNWGGRKGKGY